MQRKEACVCGILGVSNNKNILDDLYTGISCMQHRGKEGAGIAINNAEDALTCEKGPGLIIEALSSAQLIKLGKFSRANAKNGIAHVRYSTFGSTDIECIQPIIANFGKHKFAISLNGNIVNAPTLKENCLKQNYNFISDTDTEVIVALISLSKCTKFEDAVKETLPKLKGAFALIFLFQNRIYATRDPLGIRPLCIGKHPEGYILASESLAINKISGKYYRDVAPGEFIKLAGSRMYSEYWCPTTSLKFCLFEFIYFSFPQSLIMGRSASPAREEMGCLLFEEHPIEADIIVGVPDSGRNAAYGYYIASNIPLDSEAITRNRSIKLGIRSFISSDSTKKIQSFIRSKFNIEQGKVKGKNIIVVDDSIVKANVSFVLCKMLRDAEAKKIHWLAACPQYRYPCYYGIDTWRVKNELVAARHNGNLEKIRKEIGSDSLGYLSLDSTIKATGFQKQQLCTACFDGKYPVKCNKISCNI